MFSQITELNKLNNIIWLYELSWREFQIGIHSDPIRTIPIHAY